MEIKIKPVSGCLNIALTILTLGVYPLAAWLNQRNWPRSIDEQGLVTRGGKRILWKDFTKFTKVLTKISSGAVRTEHFELFHPGGRVVVAEYRLVDGSQVLDFIWNHLPEPVKQSQ